MDQYELMHYGILGMKWGIRRTKEQLGRGISKEKKVSEMSDDELRQKLNRFDMEKRYANYIREQHPKRFASVKKFLGSMLSRGATSIGNNLVDKAVESMFEKKPLITKGKIDDIGNMSDSVVKAWSERLENEKKIRKFLNP